MVEPLCKTDEGTFVEFIACNPEDSAQEFVGLLDKGYSPALPLEPLPNGMLIQSAYDGLNV